jgi:2-polyprenyl-6-methoxyphenol hydroxylase-like FAD-dependent oxidoreductase
MASIKILIIGGGVAGIASAIATSKTLPTADITVFELRKQPGNIGGAVNLTPNAVRCLDILGVLDVLKVRKLGCEINSIQLFSLHTGSSLGTINYDGNGDGFGGYRGWRVMRSELMQAMLDVAQKMGIRIEYGKKLTGLEETDSVTIKFEDGTSAVGDLVLGCDGIHSATRMYIEPARVPSYSGIASAYGFTNTSEEIFFKDSGLAMSRSGVLLTTYCDDARQRVYIAAMMESKGEISKEGWRAMGKDQEAVKENILKRFEKSALPNMKELVNGADEWFLYPVYILPPDGKWSTEKVMLLGDAAHAVSDSFSVDVADFSRCRRKGRALGML